MTYRLKVNSNIIYEVFFDREIQKYKLRVWFQSRGLGLFADSNESFDDSGDCNKLASKVDTSILDKDYKIDCYFKNGETSITLNFGDYRFSNPRKFDKKFNLERSLNKISHTLHDAGKKCRLSIRTN